jgi:acetyl esterase/lipase
MPFVYDKADVPAEHVVWNLPYRTDPEADATRHRLNLFLPEGEGWPVVVFVHGGGWTSGDKDLKVAGRDVYNNIGRYLAENGVGAAVINYRLIPDVQWPAQLEDVATAAAWVRRNIGAYGGDPKALFLMGHSAGAQLVTRVALDESWLHDQGVEAGSVCGVVAASGAGYDMEDEQTIRLSEDRGYLARRFEGGASTERWAYEASPIHHVDPSDPPFLILYGSKEAPGFDRQAEVLDARLRAAGVPSEIVVVPGQTHPRMVLALSRDDKTAGSDALRFIERTSCAR